MDVLQVSATTIATTRQHNKPQITNDKKQATNKHQQQQQQH